MRWNGSRNRFGQLLCVALAALLVSSPTIAAEPGRAAAEVRGDLTTTFPGVQLFERATRITRVYGPAFGFGASPEDTAARFVREYAGALGVEPEDLVPVSLLADGRHMQPVMYDRETEQYKFALICFSQYRDGLPVFRGDVRFLVRNEPGYPLVLAASSLRDLRGFTTGGVASAIDFDAAEQAALAAAPGLVNFAEPELMIWAGVDDMVVPAVTALVFIADNGLPATGQYQKWLFVADAQTGQVLYQEEMILHTDVVGNVSGKASPDHRADACIAEVTMPMPYARVSIGATVAFADGNGDFVIPNAGTTDVTVNSQVRGRWFNVNNQAAADASLSLIVTPPGPADFLHNPSDSQYTTAEVNAYVESNIVRDLALAANPSYPTIATQQDWPVNVNLNDTCNAYYDYSSINFFRAGGGCNNTAFGDVVHHEYGHHLVSVGGSGQGEYGEGMGDVMGVLITGRSQLGVGFQSCTTGIRNADNTFQYPCSGEIHYCGQLISGCVWDTREQLMITEPVEYNNVIRDLAVNSILLHSGTAIDPSITIDYLTLDDDDADITNGTPHYYEIATGFGAHNMDAPPLDALRFDYPNGRPRSIDPAGGTTLRVDVASLGKTPQPGTGRFFCDSGSGFVEGTMNHLGGDSYEAVFPAVPCGDGVRYYVSAQATDGATMKDPPSAPLTAYEAVSAVALITIVADDLEADLGWTVGAPDDDATTGIWNRMDPEATAAQPGDDHSNPGSLCWVTDGRAGGNLGVYDVDNGKTTLRTPAMDLAGITNATISYWRWYSNDAGSNPSSDVFVVDVSNDGGTSWVNVETVGPTGLEASGGWFYHAFDVADFVAPTASVVVRFVASDEGNGSVIEAAVDDFLVETVECPPPLGDLNCDGLANAGDIPAFVLALTDRQAYETQYPDCDPVAHGDFDGNGSLNAGDIPGFVDGLAGG